MILSQFGLWTFHLNQLNLNTVLLSAIAMYSKLIFYFSVPNMALFLQGAMILLRGKIASKNKRLGGCLGDPWA